MFQKINDDAFYVFDLNLAFNQITIYDPRLSNQTINTIETSYEIIPEEDDKYKISYEDKDGQKKVLRNIFLV